MKTLEEFNDDLERTEREFLRDSLYTKRLNQIYPKWLEQAFAYLHARDDPCSEFARLCVAHIENKHCRLSFYCNTLLHSNTMQQLLDFFQQQPQQRNNALRILRQLQDIAYQITKEIDDHPDYTKKYYNDHIAKGFQELALELNVTKVLWDDISYLEQQQEYPIPDPLMILLKQLVHYSTPYRHTLDYEENKKLELQLVEQIAKEYPVEVYHLNLNFSPPSQSLQLNSFYFNYLKLCFNKLLAKKHKYFNHPERFLYLLENFKTLDNTYDSTSFLLCLIAPFEALAKQNQLTEEIVTLMGNISFVKFCNRSIPMKRLDQLDQKTQKIITNFHKSQQQIGNSDTDSTALLALAEPYQLPYFEYSRIYSMDTSAYPQLAKRLASAI